MRRALLGWAAVGLGLLAFAPATTAAPEAKPESPLAQVPEQSAIVLHVRGFERTKERLIAMIENALPDLAPVVKKQIEEKLQGGLEGRELKGLPKDGSIFVAFLEIPEGPGTPKFAVILRVTKYTDFRDGLLNEQERKEVKADPAGFETATINNETVHFVDRKGYVVVTPVKEVAEQFTKKQAGLDGRLSKETAKKLLESDVAAYVDVGAINKKYGDQIKQGAQLIPLILGQVGQDKIDKRSLEMIKGMADALLQLLEDSRALLVSADLRPEGLAFHTQVQVTADSKTNAFLKNAKPAALEDLGKLATGQMGYWAMQMDGDLTKAFGPWIFGALGGDEAKEIKEALEALRDAAPKVYVSDSNLPLQSLTVTTYKDPAKAVAGTLKLYKSMKPGEGFQQAMLKDKPKIKENAESHRDFKLHSVSLTWDFDKMAENQPGGKEAVEVIKKIMGPGLNSWFGTDGKTFVQITAKDWESARKRLDQYLDGKDQVGESKAFKDARKQLPTEATMLALMDAPLYSQQLAETILPMLKAQGLPINIELPKNAKWKTVYMGLSLTLQPERGSFDFWLPGAAIAELRKMFDPTQQGATGQ